MSVRSFIIGSKHWLIALGATATVSLAWAGCGGGGNSSTSPPLEGGSCTSGETVCQSACTNLSTDPQNCGTCGKACGALQACSNGTCTSICASGQSACTGDGGASYCATTATDNANCGACHKSCAAGQVCSQGACATACGGAGEMECTSGGASYCAIVGSDNANCGACGKVCAATEVCSKGACVTAACAGANDLLCTSEAGAPYCVDKTSDNANCGACGHACAAAQVCTGGACVSCSGSQTYCAADGGTPYCATTSTDNANCGSCGHTCGAAQVCSNGACVAGCGGVDGGGETYCAPDGGAPYCANTATDNGNCGSCGHACGPAQVCSNGGCVPGCGGVDGGGETYCAPDGGAPYCANTQTDNANCGACGNQCTNAAICTNGNCVSNCQTVALLSTAGSAPTALITALQTAAPTLCSIDYINANSATPTLGQLERYEAILVYNENLTPYNNPGPVGDVVASYFDAGGRVVVALFADGGYAIGGGWTTKKYNLINAAFVGQLADSWARTNPAQDIVPNSLVLFGVNTITATSASWHGTQTAANGGAPVAKWASGDLLAVTGVVTDANGRKRNRVDLNVQPSDIMNGVVTGDAVKLLANALFYQ